MKIWESVEGKLNLMLRVALALRISNFILTFILGRVYEVVDPSELLMELIAIAAFLLFIKLIREGRRWVIVLLFLGSIVSLFSTRDLFGLFVYWSEIPKFLWILVVLFIVLTFLNFVIFLYLTFSNEIGQYINEKRKERLRRELDK